MSIQSVSLSSPSSSDWEYDVFLSFRGEDIRTNFLDHLYHSLENKGINVFKDDKKLVWGEDITSGLVKAIKGSRFMIVIFSETYAFSTWCLDELVTIVECKSISEEVIFPVFYKVDASEVRKQTGKYQEAFDKHKDNFKDTVEKVPKWRDALRKVADIKGWDSKNRHEVELIQEIVNVISSRLRLTTLMFYDDLVGIHSRVETLSLLLNSGSDDVRMIGIWGLGGLGKTTIARVVYDLTSDDEFKGKSFLANVRETSEKRGLITLQKQLLWDLLKLEDSSIWNVYDGINMMRTRLRHKKILLVVDDMVNAEQFQSLVGNPNWFGPGSRIIITSRDEHLLKLHGVDEVYKPKALNYVQSLQLFSRKAFKNDRPFKEYVQLSEHVVKYTGGLPLALDVLGSFFFDRTIQEWESALERLKQDPENKILDVLRISFDGLKITEKRIFLDIACFFKGNNRDHVTKVLDACGFNARIGIRDLVDKSLVTVSHGNKLWMHDLLEEMGKYIVYSQARDEPGKRSRLWTKADICHLLTRNRGTEAVESIILERPKDDQEHLRASAKAFSKMTKLRLLKIHNVKLPEGLEYLSNELRLLEWHGYPLKSLPSSLQLDQTVELSIAYSHINQLWNGNRILSNLKLVRLSHSKNLMRTPDFKMVPNLEELYLEGCSMLYEIHPSLLSHKNLIILNLQDCTSLNTLPSKLGMESLTTLVLSGCSKLRRFPEIEESTQSLSKLFLDRTAIEELPLSLGLLTKLVSLNLNQCINLLRLPSNINGLKSLKNLSLSGCSKLENVPENLGQVETLEKLDISGTAISRPEPSIFLLSNIKVLYFRGCEGLLSSILWCSCFPISWMGRRSSNPIAFMLPSMSGLCSLKKLDLSGCNLEDGGIPTDFGNLISLEELYLNRNNFVSLPESISHLAKLKTLELEHCPRLQSIQELPSSIRVVSVSGCTSLETLSDQLKLCKSDRRQIKAVNCVKLIGHKDLAVSMLKRWCLEKESGPRYEFSVVVPQSKIPEWFRYKEEGSSILIRKPPNSENKFKLAGFAFSCVFHAHKHSPVIRKSRPFGTHLVTLFFFFGK